MPSVGMIKVLGVDRLKKRKKEIDKQIGQRIEDALKLTGLALQRFSQEVCPIDTGLLRQSARTRHEGKGLNTVVRVVYLVDYAVYVHEMVYKPRVAGKIAKYLEQPMRTRRMELINIFNSVART